MTCENEKKVINLSKDLRFPKVLKRSIFERCLKITNILRNYQFETFNTIEIINVRFI